MGGDEAMEEDEQQAAKQEHTELPPSGSCQHHTETMQDYIRRAATMPIRQVPREELGPLPTFNIPIRASSGPPSVGKIVTELKNAYAPLAPLGSGTEGRDNDRLSFNSVSGASVISRSGGSRGRDPIPLTPDILHPLDRLEPDKGKHARMLIEHLT